MLSLPADRARALCLAVFEMVGLPVDRATLCADCAMFATLRGLDTHGINMVIPNIAGRIHAGKMLPNAEIGVVRDTLTTAVLKGNGAPGPVVGVTAMDLAIAKAKAHGLGCVTAFNSHHFGATSFYPVRALPHGMFGLAMCNAGAVVAPFGGAKPVHGTNPLAYAVPAGEEGPIVLDIATSVVAHHQIYKALRRGQPIPLGWALDSQGRPTTDPKAGGRGGVLLPFGGHKGYGIALLVDALTGALAGSEVGQQVNQRETNPETGGQSLFFLAIDVEAFVPLATFTSRIDGLIREIHATPPAEGFAEVLVPGDLERRQEAKRTLEGVPLFEEDWQEIVEALAAAGLPADELAARFAPDTA